MSGSDDPTEGDRSRRDLCVELEIVPAATSGCPLAGIEGEVVDVRQRLARQSCRTDVTIRPPGREEDPIVVHATSEVDATCACATFDAVDCVPEITDVADDRLVIEAYLPDRSTLADLVDRLREVVAELHLRRLRRVEGAADAGETVTVELADLTEKQREAAVRAVASGYYDHPRETSFEDLAADLGVSKPALSQRLSAVEAKLTTAAFADAD